MKISTKAFTVLKELKDVNERNVNWCKGVYNASLLRLSIDVEC